MNTFCYNKANKRDRRNILIYKIYDMLNIFQLVYDFDISMRKQNSRVMLDLTLACMSLFMFLLDRWDFFLILICFCFDFVFYYLQHVWGHGERYG